MTEPALFHVGDLITRRLFLAAAAAPVLRGDQQGTTDSSMWRGCAQRSGCYSGGLRNLQRLHWARLIGGRGFPPPAVAGGVVCAGRNIEANLVGIDAETGRPIWEAATGHVSTTPAIDKGYAYLSCEGMGRGPGYFLAVDVKTGRERWRRPSQAPENLAPAIVDDLVYFTSTTRAAVALDRRTGALRWRFQFAGVSPYLSGYTAPAVRKDVVFFGGAGRIERALDASYLFAVDRHSGRELWRAQPRSDPRSRLHGEVLEHTPVVAGDAVLCVSRNALYCFDAGGAGLRWCWPSGEGPLTAPAVHKGVAYVGTLRQLAAVEIATGKVAWTMSVDGRLTTPPSIADGAVYFSVLGRNPANLWAVDLASRKVLWRFTSIHTRADSDAGPFSSPVFCGDRLYVTNHADLYCIG
jgi:outer membrane protein assembly factor BamB